MGSEELIELLTAAFEIQSVKKVALQLHCGNGIARGWTRGMVRAAANLLGNNRENE